MCGIYGEVTNAPPQEMTRRGQAAIAALEHDPVDRDAMWRHVFTPEMRSRRPFPSVNAIRPTHKSRDECCKRRMITGRNVPTMVGTLD
jgi:hypothetical protein